MKKIRIAVAGGFLAFCLASGGCTMWESVFGTSGLKICLNDKIVVCKDLRELHIPKGNDAVFKRKEIVVKGQEPLSIQVDGKKIVLTTDATGVTITRDGGKPQFIELPPGQKIEVSEEGVFFPEMEEETPEEKPEKPDETEEEAGKPGEGEEKGFE